MLAHVSRKPIDSRRMNRSPEGRAPLAGVLAAKDHRLLEDSNGGSLGELPTRAQAQRAASRPAHDRFLEIACCPVDHTPLVSIAGSVTCSGPLREHKFSWTHNGNVLDFGSTIDDRTAKWIAESDYGSEVMARRFAGMWGFGHLVLRQRDAASVAWSVGRGDADVFYRSVLSLAIECLQPNRSEPPFIVDIGCGVGRTVYDLGVTYPNATVVAIDLSDVMLRTAVEVLVGDGDISFDFTDVGFGQVSLSRADLRPTAPILFVRANAEMLPLRAATGVDLVCLINVLDRTLRPDRVLTEALRILRPGGHILIGLSSSWQRAEHWERYGADIGWCISRLTREGFTSEYAADHVYLRELINSRGAFEEYPITLLLARRDHDSAHFSC
jgi:ubiquinone/menaquinone biosynthesis C-methylase UbiE